jgi:ubiquinone biosynthesis protein
MASLSERRQTVGRLREIAQVATRHGFGFVFERRALRRAAVIDDQNLPALGRHLRETLDELGPTFVKFGQLLSTRPDIVPAEIIAELRQLQDDVRPFPYADVERMIEEDLHAPIEKLYTAFDPVPVAAASIGQVHLAELPSRRLVAVKVQRPGAGRQIERDLSLLYQVARIVKRRVDRLDFIDPVAVVDEFARSIRRELDYRIEARTAEIFRQNFASDPRVLIPKVYGTYSSGRVLTLERLEGIQLADLDLETTPMDERRRLALLIAETWLEMIFRHGHFHGDPHPANIFVLDDGRLGLVDFGMTGSLSDGDMRRLTRLLLDAVNENVDALPRRLYELGVRFNREQEEELRIELRSTRRSPRSAGSAPRSIPTSTCSRWRSRTRRSWCSGATRRGGWPSGAGRRPRATAGSSWSCPTRCTTRWSSSATARSRCSSGTRGSTSSRAMRTS